MAGGGNWWEVEGKTVVVAYQPKGADDLSDSYINLANPGTFDASPGVAPSWNASTGWTFNGSTQYLDSQHTVTTASTSIIRVDNFGVVDDTYIYGSGQTFSVSTRWHYARVNNTFITMAADEAIDETTIVMGTGNRVISLASEKSYIDGTLEHTFSGGGIGSGSLFIGALRFGASPLNHCPIDVIAFAIYSDTLTGPQVSSLTNAMNAL